MIQPTTQGDEPMSPIRPMSGHRIRMGAVLACLYGTTGCAPLPLPGWLHPHQPEIQQGNVLEPEAIARLEAGMDRSQVRFVLGPPLLTDPFHPDRWDYLYYRQPDRGRLERKQLTLHFEDNRLTRIVRGEGIDTKTKTE